MGSFKEASVARQWHLKGLRNKVSEVRIKLYMFQNNKCVYRLLVYVMNKAIYAQL